MSESLRGSSSPEDEHWRGYIRFTSNLQASDPATLRGTQQPLELGLCRLLQIFEEDAPAACYCRATTSTFMIYANAILSGHEAAQEKRHARSSRLWSQPFAIENMLDTLEAALTCRPQSGRRPNCWKYAEGLRARKLPTTATTYIPNPGRSCTCHS
jgi:hypothetical protein